MANGEVSADEAREMLNDWQDANARGACEAPHHRYDTEITVCMCGPCSAKFTAHNSGGIAAPDLARTVVALHERVAELTRERDEARAIIDGRATPPTDAEIAKHCAAGGRWRSFVPGEFILSTGDGDAEDAQQTAAVQSANALIVGTRGVRWWALDAQCRPCAWPVVTS